jgi:predicted PolB exonuclease-like 3'-5' exonuclease
VKLNPDARHGGGHVFDTMQEWAGFRETVSLDALCRALAIASPKAGGLDGSRVYDAWIAGRAEEIAAYCRRDVEAVQAIHRRMLPPVNLEGLAA